MRSRPWIARTSPTFVSMRIDRHALWFVLALGAGKCVAQNPVVQAAVDAVNVDSLVLDLRKLTGELTVNVGNGDQTIVSRNDNQPGNLIAGQWLQQRAGSMLQPVLTQTFNTTGLNVFAYKYGAVHPDRTVVICGHYDAMPGGPVAAPAADDDGSGTVSVLEAMRVLMPHTFENTICFAFWDKEEQGLLGSHFFAGVAAANDDTIVGVVNMDAIAYDSNGDRHMKVHTKPIANSIAIKDTALLVNTTYGIDLPITVQNPGATYSDHASFWQEGYGAILVIEDFENDGNPHYHTSTDLLQYMDQGYWADLTRLSVGTAACLAIPYDITSISPAVAPNAQDITAYPNPTQGHARVRLDHVEGPCTVDVRDAMGRQVLPVQRIAAGAPVRVADLDLSRLEHGDYHVRVLTASGERCLRLLKVD